MPMYFFFLPYEINNSLKVGSPINPRTYNRSSNYFKKKYDMMLNYTDSKLQV